MFWNKNAYIKLFVLLFMGLRLRPGVIALEKLFEEPYVVSSKVSKTGRFDYQAVIFVSVPRRFLMIPISGRVVGRIVIDFQEYSSNGSRLLSDSANVAWFDADFSREYSADVYRVLKEHNVELGGISSNHS